MKPLLKMCLLIVAAIMTYSQTVLAKDTFPCEWTGFYMGTHLGGGFNSLHMTLDDPNGSTWSLHPDSSGVIGGGQIGYNLQMGKFVLGLEADLSGCGIDGSAISYPPPLPFVGGSTVRSNEDIHWFGTLRPRLGYTPIPHLLIYATGGLAYGDVNYSVSESIDYYTGPLSGSSSGMKTGWTVGGGVEYGISKRWSVKAEYLFCDLGGESVSAISHPYAGPGPIPMLVHACSTSSFSTQFNVFDVGLNYRFG
jgi:outer membrane immunogenic protein